MKMNEIYEAPAVEIVKVSVEAGFGASETGSTDSGFGFGGTGADDPV